MHPEEGGPSVEISFWMERRQWTHVKIAACSTPVPPGPWRELVPARELFANERLASHSFPPCGDGVGDPLIYSRSKWKKMTDNVTVVLGRWGDFLCFISHVQENTLGPWAENYTLAMYCVCHWSRIHQTWQPLEWQVIWHDRRCLCTRRQPRSMRGFICVTTHTCTNKKRSVCTGKTTVENNSLWPNESDSMGLRDGKISSAIMIFYLNIHILFLHRLNQLYNVIYFINGRGWYKVPAGSGVCLTFIKCTGQ